MANVARLPFERTQFSYKVDTTFVNGNVVYEKDQIVEA